MTTAYWRGGPAGVPRVIKPRADDLVVAREALLAG
jgi:hypothetical protein